jgi:hypothetical protein
MIEFIALTLEMLGAVFVAYAALRVHHRVRKEHKIDNAVIRTMGREQFVGWGGVLMIVTSYIIKVFFL